MSTEPREFAGAALLGHAVDTLMDQRLTGLSDQELVAEWIHLQRISNQITTVILPRLLMETAARGLAGDGGMKSLRRYTRTLHRLSNPAVTQLIRTAERFTPPVTPDGDDGLSRYPKITELLRTGELTVDHVAEIGTILHALPTDTTPEQRDTVETALAEVAGACFPEDIAAAVHPVIAAITPHQAGGDPTVQTRRRGITVAPADPDGMSRLRGALLPGTRALWDVYATRYARPGHCLPDRPDTHPLLVEGLTPLDPAERASLAATDHRTYAQRLHDAFHTLLKTHSPPTTPAQARARKARAQSTGCR